MTTAELTSQAIADMNADREAHAKANIRQIIGGIIAQQAVIAAAQAKITELKTVLAAVKIEPVNAADIVG